MNNTKRMKKLFGNGYDSGDILKGWDDPVTAVENNFCGGDYKKLFEELIKPQLSHAQNVLEIGPGKGSWTKAALAHMNQGTLHAVDVLPVEQFFCNRPHANNATLKIYQIENNNYSQFDDGLFDFVFSIGVFVHLPLDEIQNILLALKQKVKKNGRMVIHYSNWDKLDEYGWVKGGVPSDFKDNPSNPEMWWVKNNCQSMEAIIKKTGFRVFCLDTNHMKRDSIAVLLGG